MAGRPGEPKCTLNSHESYLILYNTTLKKHNIKLSLLFFNNTDMLDAKRF